MKRPNRFQKPVRSEIIWKVDYKMSDFFKLDEETSEKALELLYK